MLYWLDNGPLLLKDGFKINDQGKVHPENLFEIPFTNKTRRKDISDAAFVKRNAIFMLRKFLDRFQEQHPDRLKLPTRADAGRDGELDARAMLTKQFKL